jgi:protein-S-isoprenylcysteine O-methyltransferase Ste14
MAKGESLMSGETQAQSEPRIEIALVDSIKIYQVTESELDTMAAGSPTGYLFDVFLALLVFGGSLILTLTTTTINSDRLFACYTALVLVSLVGALVCFLIWLKCRKSVSQTVRKIKERVCRPPLTSSDPEATE